MIQLYQTSDKHSNSMSALVNRCEIHIQYNLEKTKFSKLLEQSFSQNLTD